MKRFVWNAVKLRHAAIDVVCMQYHRIKSRFYWSDSSANTYFHNLSRLSPVVLFSHPVRPTEILGPNTCRILQIYHKRFGPNFSHMMWYIRLQNNRNKQRLDPCCLSHHLQYRWTLDIRQKTIIKSVLLFNQSMSRVTHHSHAVVSQLLQHGRSTVPLKEPHYPEQRNEMSYKSDYELKILVHTSPFPGRAVQYIEGYLTCKVSLHVVFWDFVITKHISTLSASRTKVAVRVLEDPNWLSCQSYFTVPGPLSKLLKDGGQDCMAMETTA